MPGPRTLSNKFLSFVMEKLDRPAQQEFAELIANGGYQIEGDEALATAPNAGTPIGRLATDPPVSEAQRRAMFAAREGRSTLGIPKKVGQEFAHDAAGSFAARWPEVARIGIV
jgi:hypothetical protein